MNHQNWLGALVSLAAVLGVLGSGADPAWAQDWAAAKIEITTRMQQALGLAREQEVQGNKEGTNVDELLPKDYYQRVVLPRFRAAKTCDERKAAMAEYLGWARQHEVLGTKPEDIPEPPNSSAWLQKTQHVCVEEAYQKCKTEHDIMAFREIIRVQLSFERMRQLLGTADGSPMPDPLSDERVRQCLTFELEFAVDLRQIGFWQTTTKINLPFRIFGWEGRGNVAAEGAETPVTVELTPEPCEEGVAGPAKIEKRPVEQMGRIKKVDGALLDTESKDPASRALAEVSGKSKFYELFVHLEPGRVDARFFPCGDQGTPDGRRADPVDFPASWPGMIGLLLFEEGAWGGSDAAPVVLHFRDWEGEIPAGELYAERTYLPQGESAEMFEGYVHAKLRHKPR
jgi:hypothetical protein